jgi:hypothetical protein
MNPVPFYFPPLISVLILSSSLWLEPPISLFPSCPPKCIFNLNLNLNIFTLNMIWVFRMVESIFTN